MSTFVLVHGAWHGAWCWQKLTPLLEAKGHKVLAPDLPGSGMDETPIEEINLKAYVDCVGAIIDAQPEPVVLVGHSMGGIVITQVAEYFPEKIKSLVYLSGFLPRHGEFLLYLAEKLPDGLVNPNMVLSDDQLFASVKEDIIGPAFYTDCSVADIEMARAKIAPQAIAPLTKAVRVSEKNFGRAYKVYISCLEDKVLLPEAQAIMLSGSPCDQVLELETGHSPFLSAPEDLAELLLGLS